MKLIEDIIAEALDDNASLASILRKCLVLADKLNNDELRNWANQELDGYPGRENLPDYRVVQANAKGFFVGPLGASMSNQPLPSYILEERHRHFCEVVHLAQPIASYYKTEGNDTPIIEWPPNLTVKYQRKFYKGYALNRAWQEIPPSAMLGMLDTVRNRILRFALEIKKQLGVVADDPSSIPTEKVAQSVTNIIMGGQNIVGSTTRDVQQIGSINIGKDDTEGLRAFLADIGVSRAEGATLEQAIATDKKSDEANASIGPNTKSWLEKLTGQGLKVSREIGVGMITAAICKFLGLA